jgi:hypothetical protein
VDRLNVKSGPVVADRLVTDDALALGMIHVIINEGSTIRSLGDDWTFGFEQLKAHIQDYPPSRCRRPWILKRIWRLPECLLTTCIIQRVPIDEHQLGPDVRAIFIMNAIWGAWTRKAGTSFLEQEISY